MESMVLMFKIFLQTENWTKITQENEKTNLATKVLLPRPIGFASKHFLE